MTGKVTADNTDNCPTFENEGKWLEILSSLNNNC